MELMKGTVCEQMKEKNCKEDLVHATLSLRTRSAAPVY